MDRYFQPPSATTNATSAGRPGTLENPEVREDVPGHIIPIIEREFDDFDTESQRFLRGDVEETEFIKFRLKQGVYGQRQPDVQMIRVKLPMGGVTPDQMDAFADLAEQYAPFGYVPVEARGMPGHELSIDGRRPVLVPAITEEAKRQIVAGLNIRTVCDLRGVNEAALRPSRLPPSAERVHLPIEPSVGACVRCSWRYPTRSPSRAR